MSRWRALFRFVPDYDASDDALYRAVDIAELDALIAVSGKPVLRDSAKLTHLLTRLRQTLAAEKQNVAGLQRHVAQVQERMGRVGQATTLNPLDALRFLDDEQLEAAFTRIARQQLATLRHQVEQAERVRGSLEAELEQVRAAAAGFAQRPDLPLPVRAEFTRLLAFLPSEVRDVPRPGVLDYPDLVTSTPEAGAPGAADVQQPSDGLAVPPAEHAATAVPVPAAASGSTAASGPAAHTPHGLVSSSPGRAGAETGTAVPVFRDPYAAAGAPSPAAGPAYRDPYATAQPEPAASASPPEPSGAPAFRDPYATPEPASREQDPAPPPASVQEPASLDDLFG